MVRRGEREDLEGDHGQCFVFDYWKGENSSLPFYSRSYVASPWGNQLENFYFGYLESVTLPYCEWCERDGTRLSPSRQLMRSDNRELGARVITKPSQPVLRASFLYICYSSRHVDAAATERLSNIT